MTGLEKILNEIKKECQENIQNIENEGKKIADDIIALEQEKINQKRQMFDIELEKIVKLDLEKGVSSALSQKCRFCCYIYLRIALSLKTGSEG